jgi:hypothetical protein
MTGATFTFTVPADGIALVQVDRNTLAARVSNLAIESVDWLWVASAVLALMACGIWLGMHRRRKCG